MPDPDRKTISSTQAPALFNASPYITQWMLYQFFKGENIEPEPTSRMDWGVAMQPLVLTAARDELGIEIVANQRSEYRRSSSSRIGCTVDATAFDPNRGPGVIEVKCVFDYKVWARDWGSGSSVPNHHEIQLQTALDVGDGEGTAYEWGKFAVWVCGEVVYIDRTRDGEFGRELFHRSTQFMNDVEANRAPKPFGEAVEDPLLRKLFAPAPESVLNLCNSDDGNKWTQHVAMFEDFKDKQTFFKKAAEDARRKLIILGNGAETILLPGCVVRFKSVPIAAHAVRASTQLRVTTHSHEDYKDTLSKVLDGKR